MSKPLTVNIIEHRSKLSGRDRVHVETVSGIHLGFVDLASGEVVTEQVGYEHVMAECAHRWLQSGDLTLSSGAAATAAVIAEELAQLNRAAKRIEGLASWQNSR